MIKKLLLIGVGLIGGSFALDLKRKNLVTQVIGIDRNVENLKRAQELGVIDVVALDLGDAVAQADVIFLACPVGQMGAVMQAIEPYVQAHTYIFDAGSTKRDVQQLYEQNLSRFLMNCVPAHPIAGSDRSGAVAAQFGLFQHKRVVLSPLSQSSVAAIQAIEALWQACGATTSRLDACTHDDIFATVSHLPHLLAFAYMDMVLSKDNHSECFDFAASGFRDFTRIAGSHPEMWKDIALANKDALLLQIQAYQTSLATLAQSLAAEDEQALQACFERSHIARQNWFTHYQKNN